MIPLFNVLLTTAAEETEYLFGLDAQLLFSTIVTAINIFILFLLLSYLLFDPAREMLKKRADKITSERETAKQAKEEGLALKEEYETKLREIDREAETILSEARKKALKKEEQILSEAKEEAARIIERANNEVALERKRAMDEVKTEMIQIASMMAGKVVAANIDTAVSDALVEETLNGIGDSTWLS
ncbi:MAG: F0F1 ATP synthase subunit B [Alistipes sp.]|nr:F0F1 ATP synthase subunit B [Alistipes sp.]